MLTIIKLVITRQVPRPPHRRARNTSNFDRLIMIGAIRAGMNAHASTNDEDLLTIGPT